MKSCKVCKKDKELSEFGKNPSGNPKGRCYECDRAYWAKWREVNRDIANGYCNKYKNSNRELVRERGRIQDRNRQPQRTVYARQWRKQNPESVSRTNEKRRDKIREWITNNKELVKQWQREFLERNPGIQRAYTAKRRASLLKATPQWLDENHIEQINELYETSDRLSKFYGIPFHVDHTEPLQGKTSSGLHVWWNLRVIPATQNLSKGNKLVA